MIRLFSIVLFFSAVHPFHVSITEVHLKTEQSKLEISIHLFLDDLEEAVRAQTETEIDFYKDGLNDKEDRAIEEYISSRFKINGSEKFKTTYIGHEIEEGALWAYLEVYPFSLNDFEIVSRLLLNTFDDQENLLHYYYAEKVKSFRLNSDETVAKVRH